GDSVSEGDTVCTLEAMKMEMPISSTVSGAVKSIHTKVGDTVAYDDPLVTVS
ncbi:MAG: acetyl-CoA carboxylase biotin carboxyl carrier protein subunit, partial [Anaerolineales bacterium]